MEQERCDEDTVVLPALRRPVCRVGIDLTGGSGPAQVRDRPEASFNLAVGYPSASGVPAGLPRPPAPAPVPGPARSRPGTPRRALPHPSPRF